jgi:hypothetical protein
VPWRRRRTEIVCSEGLGGIWQRLSCRIANWGLSSLLRGYWNKLEEVDGAVLMCRGKGVTVSAQMWFSGRKGWIGGADGPKDALGSQRDALSRKLGRVAGVGATAKSACVIMANRGELELLSGGKVPRERSWQTWRLFWAMSW